MAESPLTQTLAKWRVPLGFACGALVIWMARPTLPSLLWGSAIALCGEGLRVWAAGHLEKGREVTRSGPYRFTRHPLYLGSAVIALGAVVASNSLVVGALIALYFVATVLSAIRSEEAGMRAAFGDQYAAYMESRARPVERSFSAGRAMMTNREYRSIGGLLVFATILAFKALR